MTTPNSSPYLSSAGRTKHQNTTGWLDTDRLEELGMTERQLDHLTNLSHLLAATSNVIITNVVQVSFLIFTLDGITLTVDDSVLGNLQNECSILERTFHTMQYGSGSVSTTLNSTARIPPRTKKVSPFRTGRYASKK